ncbi:SpoIIE family protein phosphatase [bacterium]|nr:SpoIIE family protein phosphatase [bacterium]
MPDKLLGHRYQVGDKLGEGGMSIIYQGMDIIEKKEVAIKFMKQEVTSQRIEDVIRFQREANAVAKLNHPGIVKVYEIGEDEGISYLVMELIKGKSLSDLLRAGRKFSPAEAVEVLIQIGAALEYVHNAGIIHRDTKPGNIMIKEYEGKTGMQAKILDFGLALVMELAEIKEAEAIIGTFSYMSPEQTGIIRKPVDERSDLYSLGIIFYELLTGELPFKGKDVGSILHQQVAQSPVSLRKRKPDIPEILEEIVLKLLRKDAAERYQTASGLIADLGKYQKGERQFLIGGEDKLRKLNYRTRLIGRSKELSLLKQMFDQVKQGKGKLCLIGGEAGRGKTRLVNELRSYVYQKGGIFISGKSFEQESKVPYHPFTEALNEYIQEIEKIVEKERYIERIREAAGDLGEEILRISPLVKEMLGEVPKLVPLEPEREIQRFLRTATNFFLRISLSESPVVLYIDDLQWLDEGSLSLLKEIAAEIGNYPLLIIGTYRDNEVNAEHSLAKLQKEAQEQRYSLEELKLDLFDQARVNQMVTELLGAEEETTSELSKYIFAKSKGNPLFINEVIRQLVDEGALYLGEERWEVDKKKLVEIIVSPNIVEIILKRIEQLEEEESRVLAYGAVIGREFGIDLLFQLSEKPKTVIIEMVDKVIQTQLIEWKSGPKGNVLFVHERIKDAFYARIDKKRRSKLHLKVGQVMEAANKKKLEEIYFDLAHHYLEGNDEVKTQFYSLRAGKKAKEAFANQEAIRYYRIAIKLLEKKHKQGNQDWVTALEDLGQVYLTSGNHDAAIKTFKQLVPFKKKAEDKALLQRHICTTYFKMGEFRLSEVESIKGLALLGEIMPESKLGIVGGVLKELIVHLFYTCFPKVFTRQSGQSVQPKYSAMAWIYFTMAWIYVLTNIKKFVFTALRALNISEKMLGKSREAGFCMAGFGCMCMAIPKFKTAIKYHFKALDMRKELGDLWSQGQSHQFLGHCYQWKGELQTSIKHFEESLEKFYKAGDMWEIGMSLNGLGNDYLHLGQFEKAIKSYQEYLEISTKIKDDFGICTSQHRLTWLNIRKGELKEAEARSKMALEVSEKKGLWFANCSAIMRVGEIHFEEGNYKRAIEWFYKARDLDKKNHFIQAYISPLYTLLAQSYIEKYLQDMAERSFGAGEKKAELQNLKKLCAQALKKTKPWKNHWAFAFRANAKYQALAGNKEKARRFWLRSIEHTEKNGQRFELGLGYYKYGEWLKEIGESQAAMENLKQAYTLFKEIGAKLYLLRTAQLLGSEEKEAEREEAETAQTRLRQRRELGTIVKAGHIISSILILEDLLEKIMDCAIEAMGAERGFLMLYPGIVAGEEIKAAKSKGLEIKVVHNIEAKEWHGDAFAASRSIIKRVEQEEKALVITDAQAEADLKYQASVVKQHLRSIICLPIMIKEEIVGIIYLDNRLVSGLFTADDLILMDSFAVQAGISIENARLYRAVQDKARMAEELRLGQEIQMSLVPTEFPKIKGLQVAGNMKPALEIGGDYYDFLPQGEDRLGIVIGDVSGKGVGAGLCMAMAKAAIHAISEREKNPKEIIRLTNRQLFNHIRGKQFMTMLYLEWDNETRVLSYSSAGHEHIIVWRKEEGKCEVIKSGGVMLGIIPEIGDKITEKKIPLERGDKVILYTDGATDARNKENKLFELSGLQGVVAVCKDASPAETLDHIHQEISSFIGGQQQFDDITLIVLQVE